MTHDILRYINNLTYLLTYVVQQMSSPVVTQRAFEDSVPYFVILNVSIDKHILTFHVCSVAFAINGYCLEGYFTPDVAHCVEVPSGAAKHRISAHSHRMRCRTVPCEPHGGTVYGTTSGVNEPSGQVLRIFRTLITALPLRCVVLAVA